MTAVAALLPDGRLHLQHGPIDLILGADGAPEAVRHGFRRAIRRFDGLLEELVAELPALRSPEALPLQGPIARRMAEAVAPYRTGFITPMAAVAGAVADAVLAALAGPDILKAYVNNGGDIALHLAPGQSLIAAIARGQDPSKDFAGVFQNSCPPDRLMLRHADPVRGIATSGWRGRSFSLGIADAVTVLARTAAEADAAATIIGNAVDLPGHPAILRRPACEIQSDSDLGNRRVTTGVGALSAAEVAQALDRGQSVAIALHRRGLIAGAALFLQREGRTLGHAALSAQIPEPCLA